MVQQRRTPLSHSFSQHIVLIGQQLVVADARRDPRVAGNLAITDLRVFGHVGMPLGDDGGLMLGALRAIDPAPRG